MKITADTNLLVRAVVADDPIQSPIAQRLLENATLVAITVPSLCEFCWVLDRVYRFNPAEVADAIRALTNGANVAIDAATVEAGLSFLDVGGDFADGVIAHDGQWLGGETFMSFDQKAVRILQSRGTVASVPQ